jgi:hypothetical protein
VRLSLLPRPTTAHSSEVRKILMLLELPPIPAPSATRAGSPNTEAWLYSRKTRHRVVFSWRPQVAGAALRILRSSLRPGRAPRTPKRGCIHEKHDIVSFFLGDRRSLVLRFASCEAVLDQGGLPEHREASIRRLGGSRAPSSLTQSPSRRASEACSGCPPGGITINARRRCRAGAGAWPRRRAPKPPPRRGACARRSSRTASSPRRGRGCGRATQTTG